MRISMTAPRDLRDLAPRWRALESASECSFFQSWTWTGCLAEERFTDPVLLTATDGKDVVALGLFNRRHGWLGERLWLGESGNAALDSVFIEENGFLVAGAVDPLILGRCLDAVQRGAIPGGRRGGRRIVLGGIAAPLASIAGTRRGTIRLQPDRPSPYVDFAVLRARGQDHMASLSANSRAQLRRSLRGYGEAGPLTLRRAGSLGEAQTFLNALAGLHQETWTRRGKPGAFAEPAFRRFHAELLARAWPRGEVELLRISAGTAPVGYLYNFVWRNWVLAYQSGFVYPDGDAHRKPGLTCHHLAIAEHLAAGRGGYDFLAGAARYKSSLSNAERSLSWLETGPCWRPAALRAWLR